MSLRRSASSTFDDATAVAHTDQESSSASGTRRPVLPSIRQWYPDSVPQHNVASSFSSSPASAPYPVPPPLSNNGFRDAYSPSGYPHETQFFASSSSLNTTTLPSSFHSSHRPNPLPRIETSLQAPSSSRLNENPHVPSYVADPLPRPRSSPVSPHNQHNANQDSLHAGPSWAVHGVHPRVPTRSSSLSDLRWLRNASPLLVVQDLPEVSPSRERSHSVSSTNSSPRLVSTRVTVPRHACPYCDKMFSRPSSLKIHENSHTGAKPHKCPYPNCGRHFSVMSNMRRHQRTHRYANLPDNEEEETSPMASQLSPQNESEDVSFSTDPSTVPDSVRYSTSYGPVPDRGPSEYLPRQDSALHGSARSQPYSSYPPSQRGSHT